ncbi:MAG: hypothetical protein ACLR13_07340 [Acutalibacteraceae bacterium]
MNHTNFSMFVLAPPELVVSELLHAAKDNSIALAAKAQAIDLIIFHNFTPIQIC